MFYMIGEAIIAPCDIKYQRMVTRYSAHPDSGLPTKNMVCVMDKVFKDTEGIILDIFTQSQKTTLRVKFSSHRQAVSVTLSGEDHAANPLVSGVVEDAQNLNTEPLSSEADLGPPGPGSEMMCTDEGAH